MIIKIAILLLWVAYSILEGQREAWYFQTTNKIKNIHTWFTLQRIIVVAALLWILQSGWFVGPIGMLFVFFHDGMYYYTRNKLDPTIYDNGWFDQSTTSTAWTDKYMTNTIRCIFFFLGVISYLWLINNTN